MFLNVVRTDWNITNKLEIWSKVQPFPRINLLINLWEGATSGMRRQANSPTQRVPPCDDIPSLYFSMNLCTKITLKTHIAVQKERSK